MLKQLPAATSHPIILLGFCGSVTWAGSAGCSSEVSLRTTWLLSAGGSTRAGRATPASHALLGPPQGWLEPLPTWSLQQSRPACLRGGREVFPAAFFQALFAHVPLAKANPTAQPRFWKWRWGLLPLDGKGCKAFTVISGSATEGLTVPNKDSSHCLTQPIISFKSREAQTPQLTAGVQPEPPSFCRPNRAFPCSQAAGCAPGQPGRNAPTCAAAGSRNAT